MKRLRLFLIPFGAVAELFILCVCWAIAFVSVTRSKAIHDWAVKRFPNVDWYLDHGRESTNG